MLQHVGECTQKLEAGRNIFAVPVGFYCLTPSIRYILFTS
ncbi:hypothetical protein J2Z66_000971 [Paenibacillus eucommiae]|uniref:Uncharacterized protein n=1 Tax=Paenibacillus eucommiae TaxID=1355755 RepID=A0ABS4IP87_9BACL|nr:hypothetical protein [Paenibacillus eucommiae]